MSVPDPAAASFLSPILAGRDDAVAALRRELELTTRGAGKTILISGEAGIGKSRLVREANAIAAELGCPTWQGNCYEQDRDLPFAPYIDLLRRLDVGLLRSDRQESRHLEQLLKLAPELARKFPDIKLAPGAEPEHEKRQLFHAWATLLTELEDFQKASTARLLILEDLHWCDDVSLELLIQLSRAITTRPIALLLTYRSDETTPALNRLLAQLDREHLAREIALKALSLADIEAMMRAIFSQAAPISHDFVKAIGALAEGNPFFVEEVLRTMVASGDIYQENGRWTRKQTHELRVPRTVQVAVSQRMDRLSEPARQVLKIAAVAGQRFNIALLQTVSARPEPELLACLRELMATQLIVENSADEFAFRHALTREAAYAAMLKRERRALHLSVGEALRAAGANDASLAYHFFEAEAWDAAFTFAQRAGHQAAALYAPREAIEQFTRAITASASLPGLSAKGGAGMLHRARGRAWEQVGEFDSALADYEVALADAQAGGDLRGEWQASLDLGFLWASRDYVKAGALFKRALEMTSQLGDSHSAAQTMNRVGNWHMNAERPFEAIRYHNEALRLFELLDDKAGVAATLDLLGISHYVAGEYQRSIEFYARSVALLRSLNDKGGLLTALAIGSSRGIAWLGRTVLPTQSLLQDRVSDCQEALRLSVEVGARPVETLAETWLGLNYAMSGEYAHALRHGRRGLAIAEAIAHRHFICTAHMVLGILHWDVMAWEPARTHLQTALALAHETNSTVWAHFCAAFLSSALIHLQDLAAAEATLRSDWSDATPLNGVGFRQLWGARAELWLAQGEPERALEAVERLIDTVPMFGMQRSEKIPYLAHLRGQAFLDMGRSRESVKAAELGRDGARESECPALEWRLGVLLGRAMLAEGKRDEAATALARARHLAERLASGLDDDALRAGLMKAASVSTARLSLDSPRRRAKAQFEGLTAREREVAGQIAQGRSNREIAEAMVVSERTVETHVANILAKLGHTSRAQVAVWAAEKGLR